MKRLLISAAVIASMTASLTLSAFAQPAIKTSASGSSLSSFLHQNAPSRTVKSNTAGKAIVTNTGSTVVLVNKKRMLSSNYKPGDLVVPDVPFSFSGASEKKKMRRIAANALENLFDGAKKAGISIKAVSGFRSYATQQSIFNRNAKLKGEAVANKTSARPGQSEHQTGLAMDVSSASVKYGLEQSFGATKEGKWLKAHAAEYGFIIRYPQGKEKITGYSYEPWHIRYVGVYIAGQITAKQLTLEEYMAQQE